MPSSSITSKIRDKACATDTQNFSYDDLMWHELDLYLYLVWGKVWGVYLFGSVSVGKRFGKVRAPIVISLVLAGNKAKRDYFGIGLDVDLTGDRLTRIWNFPEKVLAKSFQSLPFASCFAYLFEDHRLGAFTSKASVEIQKQLLLVNCCSSDVTWS